MRIITFIMAIAFGISLLGAPAAQASSSHGNVQLVKHKHHHHKHHHKKHT